MLSECETLDLLEDIAYIGGAVMEENDYCDGCVDGDCLHCSFEMDDFKEDELDEDDEDDE